MLIQLSFRKPIIKIIPLRIMLLHFLILFITLFTIVGCDDSSASDSNGSETEDKINVTVSHGASLPEGSLQDKLLAISQRTDKNVIYDIAIESDASFSPLIVMTQGQNVIINIHSVSNAIHTLTLNSPGSLFTVGANATLVLENIILKGHPHNNKALISVVDGGTLIIMNGTVIRDNQNENRAEEGGGVYVGENSKMFMKGGEICFNYCGNRIKWDSGDGGGIYLNKSFFNMTDGIIHHNETEKYGGGVNIFLSTFIMNGGEIAANTALNGGGVYIYGEFTKEPLPKKTKSGVIWGYPGNGKENYANGCAVYWYQIALSQSERRLDERTIGEYDSLSTNRWEDWTTN